MRICPDRICVKVSFKRTGWRIKCVGDLILGLPNRHVSNFSSKVNIS